MAYRLSDQNPQYRKDDGTLAALGSLTFSITGTSTAKNVYSSPSLGTSNGAVLTLDAAARVQVGDVWMDGIYRVQLKDAAGVQIWLRDDVRDLAAGGISPLNPATGTVDQVYSTNGTTALWRTVREVPDPTGHSNKILGNNGTTAAWEAKATAAVYTSTTLPGGITSTTTRVVVGIVAFLTGSGTSPNTGTLKSTLSVTFATAFTGTPTHVSITPTSASSTGEGGGVSAQATGISSTGFTANFFAGAEDQGGVAELTSTIPFTFLAIGPA